MIFRIDDVSVNTDLERLNQIVGVVIKHVPEARFMFAISPLVHDLSNEPAKDHERAFPRRLSAMSDHRVFFLAQRLGNPLPFANPADIASHGLVHVDHRLMGREAQELSIVTSCSLLGTKTFVPPFNKWNKDTESVCEEYGITLVKFENGWRHINYNKFEPGWGYYCHTHDVSPESLERWFTA